VLCEADTEELSVKEGGLMPEELLNYIGGEWLRSGSNNCKEDV